MFSDVTDMRAIQRAQLIVTAELNSECSFLFVISTCLKQYVLCIGVKDDIAKHESEKESLKMKV